MLIKTEFKREDLKLSENLNTQTLNGNAKVTWESSRKAL